MNICMIYYSVYTGNSTWNREAGSLVERGDQVDIICLGREGEEKVQRLENLNIYSIQKRKYDEKGPLTYLRKLLRFFFVSFFLVTRLFLKKRYNVIQVISPPDFMVFSALIPKIFGTKLILDLHDPVPEFYVRKFNQDPDHIIVKALKWLEKVSADFADHVIVVTDLWREIITKRSTSESKCTVLLNTPDRKIFAPCKASDKPGTQDFVIIYAGNMLEHCGLEVAIKAAHIASRAIPSIRLEIYGKGRMYSEFVSLARELKLSNIVTFHDPVNPEKLVDLISEADVGIEPKHGGIYAGQTLSVKVLEYLAVGIPVIVTRTETTLAYFDESMVMFFEPGNVIDLARCIIELYGNPEKRKNLVKNAHRFNEKHNWETYKKVYWSVLDSLSTA